MTGGPIIRVLDRQAVVFLTILSAVAILVPLSNLLLPVTSPFHVPTYAVALFGKYICYALLALSIDLIWGYCGILSLGHGAFFALGGYAMGMYLMRQIGTRGVYANPILPDFMVFLNWKELPIFWYGFQSFPYALLMVFLAPGALAFLFGWFAFRSRVTGVYLSIITQAMTFALLLAFFRNDFGFGGNNGLTDFKDILGFNVQAQSTRAALFAISCAALGICFIICRKIVTSKLGKVLVAIRDAESRTRFLGYRVENYKLFVWTAVRLHGGARRRALRAAGRHHQSGRIRTRQFDRGGALGRGRRPRHADRRGARRDPCQLCQDDIHQRHPRALLAVPARRACLSSSRCSCRAASSARCRITGASSKREAGRCAGMTSPARDAAPKPAE